MVTCNKFCFLSILRNLTDAFFVVRSQAVALYIVTVAINSCNRLNPKCVNFNFKEAEKSIALDEIKRKYNSARCIEYTK